jgi:hypothetical protein
VIALIILVANGSYNVFFIERIRFLAMRHEKIINVQVVNPSPPIVVHFKHLEH